MGAAHAWCRPAALLGSFPAPLCEASQRQQPHVTVHILIHCENVQHSNPGLLRPSASLVTGAHLSWLLLLGILDYAQQDTVGTNKITS